MRELTCLLFCLLTSYTAYAEEVPTTFKQLIPVLQSWGKHPVLVATVKDHNAKNINLKTIMEREAKWVDASKQDTTMQAMHNSPARLQMLTMEKSIHYLREMFLMGNQGANIAMTNKTSDYWQGDEEKFTESYKGGTGGVHIGVIEFDDSAQAYLVQVSVPVMEAGKAIGAITTGIDLDKFEAIYQTEEAIE